MLVRLGNLDDYARILDLLGLDDSYCLLKALLKKRSAVVLVDSGRGYIRCAALIDSSGLLVIGGDGSRKQDLYLERLRWHAREVRQQMEEGLIG